jgi:hypothetical protein
MPEEQPEKKIDLGWKEQAQREKEQLSEELDQGAAGGGDEPPELSEPSFLNFVNGMAVQAAMFLGQVENPVVGKRILDLPAAKYNIDALGIIAEKTKGNLTAEEDKALTAMLGDLRMAYVETLHAVERAMAERAAKGQLKPKPGKP